MSWSEAKGRAIVYARSGRRCEVCGRQAESVHHRMKQGRPWNPANLLSLCGDGVQRCHGWIEAHPIYAQLLGLWVPRGVDAATIPQYVKPEQFPRGWWMADDDGCWTFMGDPPADHPLNPQRETAVYELGRARLPL